MPSSKNKTKTSKPSPQLAFVESGSSPGPLLLDIPATARALSSTVWAVRQLLWDKKIPHIRIGKKFLVDPQDLRAFIQRQKAEGRAA